MKIAVNIHCLHPPLTGIGHYARHMLQVLIDHPQVKELVGVSHEGWHSQEELREILADSDGWILTISSETIISRSFRVLKIVLREVPGLLWLKQKLLSRPEIEILPHNSDFLYWEPNYLPLPGISNTTLITVHDLSHIRYPQFHPSQRLRELENLPQAVSGAGGVITVSHFTKSELQQYFDVSEDMISVVSPAIGSRFSVQPVTVCNELIERYGLPKQFVLFVGTIEPRKNLKRLVEAYDSLPLDIQREYPMLIAGSSGWHVQEFDKLLKDLANRNILRLGYIDSVDLPALYSAASVFVYPSLYEGFGMPVLEAMASGTAVITSNVASMPEVAAGAAELVDPEDTGAITKAMAKLLANGDLRQNMVANGLEVSSRYKWQNSANNLIEALARMQS